MNTQLAIELEPSQCAIAARSRLYEKFSQMFRFPADDSNLTLLIENNPLGFEQSIQELPYTIPEISSELLSLNNFSNEEIRSRYTNLFESARGTILVPLNESEFVDSPRSMVWEDLIRFYEHFGLHYDGEKSRQWPDHLVVELECLQYLGFLQAGIKDNAEAILQAQYDFIDRHLTNWIPKLKDRLENAEDAEPYLGILECLYQFLLQDKAYLLEKLNR